MVKRSPMDGENKPGALQTLQVCARILGVPTAWLRAEAEEGRVPCLHTGRSYLFDVDLVEHLLLERARQGGPNAA
jgi:hypothetical protein